MAYRGRGRGRGRGGYDNAKNEPFVIFPEITLPDPKSIPKDTQLVSSYFNFQKFWRNSPYYLGDGVSKKENESVDIERFSDMSKPKKKKSNKSGSFYDFLVLRPDNFPRELLGDVSRERPAKRAKWSVEADLQKLDVFEKLEAKLKAEGKEEESDEEEEEEVEESEEEDNGDYEQNQDFDDDDDDYNQVSDGDNEPMY